MDSGRIFKVRSLELPDGSSRILFSYEAALWPRALGCLLTQYKPNGLFVLFIILYRIVTAILWHCSFFRSTLIFNGYIDWHWHAHTHTLVSHWLVYVWPQWFLHPRRARLTAELNYGKCSFNLDKTHYKDHQHRFIELHSPSAVGKAVLFGNLPCEGLLQ